MIRTRLLVAPALAAVVLASPGLAAAKGCSGPQPVMCGPTTHPCEGGHPGGHSGKQ